MQKEHRKGKEARGDEHDRILAMLRAAMDDSDAFACPDAFKLERFTRGELPEPEADAVRVHVNVCEECRRVHETSPRPAKTQNGIQPHRSDLTTSVVSGAQSGSSPAGHVNRHLPQIEGYRITGVLGQGGMGIVYRAVQTKLNRAVALKVLPAMVGGANPKAVERFRREATAAARLHHTHIVPIYDFGESKDAYFYAMELIAGQSLAAITSRLAKHKAASLSAAKLADLLWQIIANPDSDTDTSPSYVSDGSVGTSESSTGRSRIYYQRVARWMADAADALHYAHLEGIVHRDIKPANLIVAPDGRIVIADFGLAKMAGEHSLTLTGSFLGTARYMSPEQAMSGRVRVDHRTDVYSLGTTLYELLCFRPAFHGEDEKEVLGAVIAREPTRPRKIASTVPPELDTICLKCLEKHPNARYDTARDLAEDLRRFLRDLPIAAKRPSVLRRSVKFVRRHRGLITALTAAVFVIAAGALALGIKSRSDQAITAAQSKQLEAEAKEIEALAKAQEEKIKTMLRNAIELGREKKWREADSRLREALALDPNDPRAVLALCWLQREELDLDPHTRTIPRLQQAEQTCRRALELNPNHVLTLNYLAQVLRMRDRRTEAIQILQSIIDLNPDFYAWSNLGANYALDHDLDRAEHYLREGVVRAGQASAAAGGEYVARAWRNLAAVEGHLQKPEALSHLSEAIKTFNQDQATWALRSKLLSNAPRPEEWATALGDANTADRLAGGLDPTVKRILALALLRNGQHAQAAIEAQKALELNDSLPTALHLIRAIAFVQTARSEEAREAWRKAQDTWPSDLTTEADYRVNIEKGVLSFESGRDLFRLREEAQRLIDPSE